MAKQQSTDCQNWSNKRNPERCFVNDEKNWKWPKNDKNQRKVAQRSFLLVYATMPATDMYRITFFLFFLHGIRAFLNLNTFWNTATQLRFEKSGSFWFSSCYITDTYVNVQDQFSKTIPLYGENKIIRLLMFVVNVWV